MASNATALRVAELTSYSTEDLVNLLRTTHLKSDFDAVTRVLSARESRAAQAEAQLQATLDHALRKVQALEDLRGAEAEESARLSRTAEEEARSILEAAVCKIHEGGKKKKQDEVSVHLDAVLDEIHALRKRQGEDLSATMAVIVEETEAKLKASFPKLKPAERDAVPSQEGPDDTALTLAVADEPTPLEKTGQEGEGNAGPQAVAPREKRKRKENTRYPSTWWTRK
jgi:hypothetical protein